MLPNMKDIDPNFETLRDEFKIIPNFKSVNCNLVKKNIKTGE
jgi:hypothetical protein